jgi:hypothetical protein
MFVHPEVHDWAPQRKSQDWPAGQVQVSAQT